MAAIQTKAQTFVSKKKISSLSSDVTLAQGTMHVSFKVINTSSRLLQLERQIFCSAYNRFEHRRSTVTSS